jgi:hypothetical protein
VTGPIQLHLDESKRTVKGVGTGDKVFWGVLTNKSKVSIFTKDTIVLEEGPNSFTIDRATGWFELKHLDYSSGTTTIAGVVYRFGSCTAKK